jgi:hypothetical protein
MRNGATEINVFFSFFFYLSFFPRMGDVPALSAVVEVSLHFVSLFNTDLFNQGLYHVRARVYTEHDRALAVPFLLHGGTQPAVLGPAGGGELAFGAALDPEARTARTDTFYVRYREEHVPIDNVAHFRCVLQADPRASSMVALGSVIVEVP